MSKFNQFRSKIIRILFKSVQNIVRSSRRIAIRRLKYPLDHVNLKMSKFDLFVRKLFRKCSKHLKTRPGEQTNRDVSCQEISNGNSKPKFPAPLVTIRFQQRRHFDFAAILNWFGSEHLHHRFGCPEYIP